MIISGTIDGGKNYLLKGSNSNPGLVPSLQKRMVQWLGTFKVMANISHFRYSNGMLVYLSIHFSRSILGFTVNNPFFGVNSARE